MSCDYCRSWPRPGIGCLHCETGSPTPQEIALQAAADLAWDEVKGKNRWVIQGRIEIGPRYEADDVLFVHGEPMAEQMEAFDRKQVYAAYGFSGGPISPTAFLDMAIETAEGLTDAEFGDVYSEITGYLWTDQEGSIGGHDMIRIFESHVGEYGLLLVQMEPIDLGTLVESAASL